VIMHFVNAVTSKNAVIMQFVNAADDETRGSSACTRRSCR